VKPRGHSTPGPRLLFAAALVLAAACAVRAQTPGPPGGILVGAEALDESGTQLYLPAGFGPRQYGWLVDYEQATARDGTFSLSLDSATDGNVWRSGNNLAAWRNAPLLGGQANFFGGTVLAPSDLLDTHFANLFSPQLMLSGGEFTWQRQSGWQLALFAGRNLISQGPYIPFFTSAPDLLWGASLRPPQWHRWQFEARYLRTRAAATSGPLLNGALGAVPASSQELYLNGNWRWDKDSQWLNEIAVSRAAAKPDGTGGSFISFASGPVLERPRYDVQAYALRQGADYFPVSNEVLGDREGGYVAADLRPWRRWSFSGNAADLRDNVQNNAATPTLDALSTSAAATFSPGEGYSLTGSVNQTALSSPANGAPGAGGAARLWATQVQAARVYGPNQTQLRWQDWVTHAAAGLGATSAIQTEEVQQQRNFGGNFLSAAFGLQQGNNSGSPHALSLHMNLAADLNWGQRVSLFASGQIGRDLRDQSALSLTSIRTWVAAVQVHLPAQFELSGQFVRNAVVSQLNAQRLLLAGLASGPVALLPGTSQQVVFVRLTKSFRWGARVPMWGSAGGTFSSSLAPSYGSVEGVVFDDRAHTGERAPGDEGLAGVVVRLNGAVATSDTHGRFQFNGVRTGHYTLEIDVDHLPVRYTPPPETEIPIEVRASGTPAVQIPLQLAGSIRGQVRSEGASDLAGIALRLTPGHELAFTDSSGAFHFDNVPPGRYAVQVLKDSLPPGVAIEGRGQAPVAVASGAVAASPTLRLHSTAQPRPVQVIEAPAEQIVVPLVAPPPAQATAQAGKATTRPAKLKPVPSRCRPSGRLRRGRHSLRRHRARSKARRARPRARHATAHRDSAGRSRRRARAALRRRPRRRLRAATRRKRFTVRRRPAASRRARAAGGAANGPGARHRATVLKRIDCLELQR